MHHVLRDIARLVERWGPEDYVLVVGVLAVVGFLCLRGFGSRKRY